MRKKQDRNWKEVEYRLERLETILVNILQERDKLEEMEKVSRKMVA